MRRGLEIVDGEVVPALRVATTEGRKRDPYATIRTPAFDITNHVVLTDAPDLFGLRTAMDAGSGHFPDVSTAELYVQEAAQAARARFDALGFEAAAVTAVKMGRIATLATSSFAVRVFDLTFDRPFGFLAVDRRSGLVLFAGWVNDPEPWADPEP